jgi:hypothetical protein
MARALLILANDAIRAKATRWIAGLPVGTRVEFKEPRRTLDQNNRMWAMLTDIATQKEHCGRRYSADDWKVIFLHALGRETRFVPALDGHGFVPLGQSSSDLSKAEMSEMIEMLACWGAENGVIFHDEDQRQNHGAVSARPQVTA